MLVSPKQILEKAKQGNYAVGHFNTSDLEITQAIIIAAQKEKAPVIVATTPKAIKYAGLEQLATIIKNLAAGSNIPIVLHLDHGKDLGLARKCLQLGYTSIMIDGSELGFKKNINLTKQVVEVAHQKEAMVEGEIGVVGGGAHKGKQGGFTDPDEAQKYVQETGVDALAVSIGNAHGGLQPDEFLNFELLRQIEEKVKIPLVLHGASGTPENQIKKAIQLGICKINIDTDIRLAFRNSIKEFVKEHSDVYDPREIMIDAMEAIEKVVRAKIKLFGSSNKD